MKIIQILIALLLTVALLYIAKRTSRGHPEEFSLVNNGFTLKMMTVPKAPEQARARLEISMSGPLNTEVYPVLRFARSEEGQDLSNLSDFQSVPLILADSTRGSYFMELSTGVRGQKMAYFFEVRDEQKGVVATFQQPRGAPWVLKYIGEVPKAVLIGHIGFIFATIFCVALAAMFGLQLVAGYNNVRPMASFLGLATLFTFFGGYPFGFAMNWFAFGTLWEGVPFGTDATDNKTQLLLVYLLFATLISLGSLSRGRMGRDLFRPKALGWFGIGGVIVSLLIYLIPHSIQFGAGPTYAFCYSFMAVWVIVYLYGYFTSRPGTGSVRK